MSLPATNPQPAFQLKKLKPKHRQVAALLAQGVGRAEVAAITGITPEYVSMLARQPLFMEYVKQLTEFTDVRLQALYDKSVDVLADTLVAGSEDARLRAAGMVMKATGKEGTSRVQADVNHTVSLVSVLRTLPPVRRTAEPFQIGTTLSTPAESSHDA